MSTIPASEIVQVNPAVLPAGGRALDINGVILTHSTRVPIGAVQPFATADDVSDYFGGSSQEADLADNYFNGFENSSIKPAQVFYTQFNPTAVPAYLRGGTISGITLQQLQLLSGTLILTVDGYLRTSASISLAAATSFSSAAALIQAGFVGTEPTAATVTGSIGPGTASLNGYIDGNILTATTVTGTLRVGGSVGGSGVAVGTRITGQLSGVDGAAGTYAVSISQTVPATAMTLTFGILTVASVASGFVDTGQTVTGTGGGGVTAGTIITAGLSGTGGTGTYIVAPSGTVSSTTLVLKATPLTVTYDSTSNSFLLTSGVAGAASTVTFATGTLAASINFTQAEAAVLSQGANPAIPGTFMDSITDVTQNWATFMTAFDPDSGSGFNTQKLLFAQWTAESNNRYAYVCWDPDEGPAATNPDVASLGWLLNQSNSSGTFLFGQGVGASNGAGDAVPVTANYAAFICGAAASINFEQFNGRTTFAFRVQSGLFPTVTDATSANNLLQNGYNYYGAYATANDDFIWVYNGQISGEFLWMDSYINQIWMNNAFQLALMVLLKSAKSIPYNTAGYSLISAALLDPILAAVNFGAIRPGITLSESQAAQVNSQAGVKIDDILNRQGWYLQVRDASPQVRQARGTPPCTFWYMDGQSVQRIVLASIELT